jgi:hypothetical protein
VGQQNYNTYESPPPTKISYKRHNEVYSVTHLSDHNFYKEGGTVKPAGAVGKDSLHYLKEHE